MVFLVLPMLPTLYNKLSCVKEQLLISQSIDVWLCSTRQLLLRVCLILLVVSELELYKRFVQLHFLAPRLGVLNDFAFVITGIQRAPLLLHCFSSKEVSGELNFLFGV